MLEASANCHAQFSEPVRRYLAERGIEIAPPAMTRQDVEHESAVSDLRHGLLNHPDVIKRLLELAELRDGWASARWFADQWRGRRGGLYWQVAGWPLVEAQIAYCGLLDLTERQLDRHFDQGDLDRFASTIRERLALDLWGKTAPVSHGGERYGRAHERARTHSAETVGGAIEAIARRLNPERRHPLPGGADAERRRQQARRKHRERMRKLASN